MQQAQLFSAHDGLFRDACFAARMLEARCRKGIDRRVDRLHLRDARFQQFDRRDLTACDQASASTADKVFKAREFIFAFYRLMSG